MKETGNPTSSTVMEFASTKRSKISTMTKRKKVSMKLKEVRSIRAILRREEEPKE